MKPTGLAGGSTAVTVADSTLAALPRIARISNVYVVPLTSPVTGWTTVVGPLFAIAVQSGFQVLPRSSLCRIWYAVMVVSFGSVQLRRAPRSLAGNPDSPQAVVFLTSIIDEIVSIATYYMHYHVISDLNASVLRYAKPGKWLSGQTSRRLAVAVRPLGAPGGGSGVAVTASVSAPAPMLFTARSLKA